MTPTALYRASLALLTDLYQLSMGQAYFEAKMTEHEAVFHLYFRKLPFGGKYALAGGLAHAIDIIQNFRFTDEDIKYLMTIKGNDGRALFNTDYLTFLRTLDTSKVQVSAPPEGSAVFPNEPLLRVQGPLIVVQMLETVLLTVMNFQTLIATKASRVKAAAKGKPVLEFGLRRAQGIDGGLAASRACYLGGVDATSNVLAGQLYGIPVKGTHAHSMVMAFGDQKLAFKAYADACPNNVTLLVDTYDTMDGVADAIRLFHSIPGMRTLGGPIAGGKGYGIRLDSGDLADLSKQARSTLDAAGLSYVKIVASSDLDEYEIAKLEAEGACIDVYGVGTNMVTAKDQPALGGVYKIAAIRSGPQASWEYRIKLSQVEAKVTTPGILQVTRYTDASGTPMLDIIHEDAMVAGRYVNEAGEVVLVDKSWQADTLLRPVLRNGEATRWGSEPLNQARVRAVADAAVFRNGIKVVLSAELVERKSQMIADARKRETAAA